MRPDERFLIVPVFDQENPVWIFRIQVQVNSMASCFVRHHGFDDGREFLAGNLGLSWLDLAADDDGGPAFIGSHSVSSFLYALVFAAERLSSRGRANSFQPRRTSHDAKHAPAAPVQRFV